MTESIDAVALLRVPDWEPPEDLDCRELDDGVLVFLPIAYDSEDVDILDALEDAVGDAMYDHEDERGLFVFPDTAEPEEAETYDDVVAKVGASGQFLSTDTGGASPELAEMFGGGADALVGQVFQAMGIDDPDAFMKAMRDGDEDVLKLAQIQMQSRLEEAMRGVSGAPEEEPPVLPETKTDEPKK